jgi:hypothetical protein
VNQVERHTQDPSAQNSIAHISVVRLTGWTTNSAEVRRRSGKDIAVAEMQADVATTSVINASTLRRQEQPSEHLQEALGSRVVIEQAKGSPPRTRSPLMRPPPHLRPQQPSRRAGDRRAIVAVGLQV